MTAEGIWHYGSGNEYRSTDLIEVKEGKTYTSSLYNKNKERIAYLVWTTYDINKNFIAQYTTSNIVISSGVKYIRARNYQAQTSYIINDDYLYQVEENNTPTNYEPYVTPQVKQLSLGDKELAKIGNYVDTIEYDVENDKVYKNKNVNKVVFNGSETWSFVNLSDRKRSYISVADIVTTIEDSDITPMLCTNFINTSYSLGQGAGQPLNVITGRKGIAQINIFHNIADNNTDFKAWLSNNQPIAYYPLAETIKEEITGTLKDQIKDIYNLMSYTGTTILEVDGDLPMIIKCRGLKGE